MLSAVFSEPVEIALVCLVGGSALCSLYIAEILCNCGIDRLALCSIRLRLRFDISGEDSRLEVPGVLRFAGGRTNCLPLQLAIFPPGEIEMPALAARGFTMDEDEPRIGLPILPDDRDELPAVADSAILYKVDELMTVLTDHVLRATSIFGTADERDFRIMISEPDQLNVNN